MTASRYRAWVRVLCAVALGLGISGAAAAAATPSAHLRPAVASVQDTVRGMAADAAHAPLALGHLARRHAPASVGVASLVVVALVGGLVGSTHRRRRASGGGGRRTTTAGARAPPVVTGI